MTAPHRQLSPKAAGAAANGVLVCHTAFALFAVVGAPIVLLSPWWALLHLPVVLWSSLVNLADWTCPLTPLEHSLRRQAGQTGLQGGWLQHYLEPVVRPLGMPRRMELIAGYSVLIWNALVYGLLISTSQL